MLLFKPITLLLHEPSANSEPISFPRLISYFGYLRELVPPMHGFKLLPVKTATPSNGMCSYYAKWNFRVVVIIVVDRHDTFFVTADGAAFLG